MQEFKEEHPVIQKIALVTGATRGIGKAIALELAKQGIITIGTATTESGAKQISEYLHGTKGYGVVLDVSNVDSINNVVNDIKTQTGEINILINNAGITKDNLCMRMTEENWDSVIDTNLKSVFLLSKAIMHKSRFLKNRYGRIVNIASVVGFSGTPGQVNYSAAKGGMVAFSKSLALELGSRGITVNCVAPGFIETEMTAKLPESLRDTYIKHIALEKFGTPQDVASSVRFLVSDEASYITGTTIHVNGGLYM